MLTKQDLAQIEGIVKNAFQDFYDNLFEPTVTRFEKKFEQHEKKHDEMMRELTKLSRRDEVHEDVLRGHEGRITDLERRSF